MKLYCVLTLILLGLSCSKDSAAVNIKPEESKQVYNTKFEEHMDPIQNIGNTLFNILDGRQKFMLVCKKDDPDLPLAYSLYYQVDDEVFSQRFDPFAIMSDVDLLFKDLEAKSPGDPISILYYTVDHGKLNIQVYYQSELPFDMNLREKMNKHLEVRKLFFGTEKLTR
jgi:hypothetical protein